MNFKNKTILITGGAQGIGFALSKKFSTMGANVVIADKHKDTPNIAEKVLQEISTEKKMKIGKIEDAFEPKIQSIVDNWPTAVDGFRAEAIGLPKPPSLKKIIEQYLELFN